VNEIGNRVPLTKSGNMDVFDRPPDEYLPLVQQANPTNLEKFMVPSNTSLWSIQNYETFLAERRKMISEAINEYMVSLLAEKTGVGEEIVRLAPPDLIATGENDKLEFKATLRWNIHAERVGKEIEHETLKTIAAFLNSEGGTLLIGVSDSGEILGLDADGFENDDRFLQTLNEPNQGSYWTPVC
jgi:hypothetical protein